MRGYDPLRLDCCNHCRNWGTTVTIWEAGGMLIPCPECGRGTWANLGVNCPAGSSVSFGAGHSLMCLDEMKKAGMIPIQVGQDIWTHYTNERAYVVDGLDKLDIVPMNPAQSVRIVQEDEGELDLPCNE